MTLTLDDLKTWPRQELDFTIECSGNHGLPFLWGGIGNARWAGISLASLLDEAGVLDVGREVACWGADAGEETLWGQTVVQNFARSMSLEDAMGPYNLLAYEMNGETLPQPNGYPLRLIAPGWFGVANVKWLTRIEVRSSRLMNRFMARDYVTLRQEEQDGEAVWTESSVGRSLLKSAPARVVSSADGYRIEGAAWGAPIQRVEVQVDDGEWQVAELDTENVGRFAWRFWTLDWPDAEAGEHNITSRASAGRAARSAATHPRHSPRGCGLPLRRPGPRPGPLRESVDSGGRIDMPVRAVRLRQEYAAQPDRGIAAPAAGPHGL
jgi:DMSO/TMAO reductase YedYZ molybdopterin-dependent catalytic subunit